MAKLEEWSHVRISKKCIAVYERMRGMAIANAIPAHPGAAPYMII